MSELIVTGFQGELRACQVITEIRLLHREASDTVDHAIVVTRDRQGRIRVHRTVDPTSDAEPVWERLWNSLISAALLVPLPGVLSTAARPNSEPRQTVDGRCSSHSEPRSSARWWIETMSLSSDFVADIGAVLRRDCSAILMLTRMADSSPVVQQLRRCGGTFLRHSLALEPEDRLSIALGSGPVPCELDGRRA